MEGLTDAIAAQLGGDVQRALARQLGVDDATAGRLVQAALPTILAGLERNSRQPEGAADLHHAIAKKHDGAVLDDLLGYVLAGGDPTDGNAILGHIFGGREAGVAAGVGKASALDSRLLQQAMAILAPIVLGYLGRKLGTESLDTGGLIDVLVRGGVAAGGASGGGDLGSVLGSLLEGMSQAGTTTTSEPAPSSTGAGLLGKLLGALMGRGGQKLS